MRRKEREVKNIERIKEIVEACQCCRLGLYDGNRVYIVPLNFGYTYEGEKLILYFHSAKEGHKIDLMKEHQNVGFEMDTAVQLKEGTFACQYSTYYQSLIGHGCLSFIEEHHQKEQALLSIMQHYTQKNVWSFSSEMLDAVCIFQLVVEEVTCKENINRKSF